MTTFFDPPHLQAICLRLAGTQGILNALLTGRAHWTLEQFLARPPASGLTEDQIDTRRRETVAFLNDRKLAVLVAGEDATITFSPFAAHPYVDPMPPSLIPCGPNHTVICGYTSFHCEMVPITKCLMWDGTVGRERFFIRFAVGERGFTKMPEGWMLEQGTERYCNEALAGMRWYKSERKAIDHAGALVYPFGVRNMALNGELLEELVDLDKPPAKVEVPDAAPDDDDEQVLSFVA